MINSSNIDTLRRKRLISAYTSDHSPSSRGVKQKPGNGNLEASTEAGAMMGVLLTALLTLACSACFTIAPNSGLVLHIMGWSHTH